MSDNEIKTKDIILEGNKYKLIEGTQGDGRCFAASIFYDLNRIKAEDDELNIWIKDRIIDPILEIEKTNCPKFLLWATQWAGIHNYNLINQEFPSKNREEIIITSIIQDVDDIFDRLINLLKTIINTISHLNNVQLKNISDMRLFLQDILKITGYFIDNLREKKLIKENPNFMKLFENLHDTVLHYSINDNAMKLPDNDIIPMSFFKFLDNVFGPSIVEILNTICYKVKANDESITNLLQKYKEYINSLNIPFVNSNGDNTYEWIEPQTGPIDVLLREYSGEHVIKSINIYSTLLHKFQNYISDYEGGSDVYLYYTGGNHYMPLFFEKALSKPKKSVRILDPDTTIDSSKISNIPLKTTDKSPTSKSKSVTASGKQNTTQIINPTATPLESSTDAEISQISVTNAKPVPTSTSPISITNDKPDLINAKKEDSDTNKKDDKVPNSLIIYIKTRLPNFYKINYEPYMSVPKNTSHTVYFDPLIKYYEGPIKNIPRGAPKDAILTQFFEAAEFDSMINRILSNFRYMQKKRTFQQSYDEHIIENNLKITIKNLFKTNNLFYLNKKPYTIVGVKFDKSDWQIDKKPLEQLLKQFTHLTPKQIEEEAKKEEDDIPEILRQGNVASSNITDGEKSSIVAAGLKKASEPLNDTTLNQEISGITDAFVAQTELPGVSGDIVNLYTKYLRKNVPINYSNNTDLARDPLTLSLLVDPSDLLNFINQNKKSTLIDLYSTFINSKISLHEADKTYIDLCVELAKYKTNFDTEMSKIKGFIRNKISKLEEDEKKQKTTELMLQITQLKIGYMQIIFKIADTINQIYQLQKVYFIATKELLEGLKHDYVTIIKYYTKPELAWKCIDNDIAALSSLIEQDPEDPYSVSYYKNYNNFTKFYETQLYKNRQQLLEPRVNFAEEAEKYINYPNILLIEKEQYEIYNFKMFLSYSYNQFDIWVVLFKSIETFITSLGIIISNIIGLADITTDELNENYTIIEQNTYLKKIGMEGIRADFDRESEKYTWHLVKEDGKNAIKSVERPDKLLFDNLRSQHRITGKSLKDIYSENKISNEELFQDLYIEYIKTSVNAYDAIILYMYLLEILCLRQNRVYVAEENINQLNLEYSLTLDQYYNIIINNINTTKDGSTVQIPQSILWDISNLNNIEFVKNKQTINTKSNVIFRARIKAINESRNNLVSSCEEISKIITQNISKTGFIKQCNNIVTRKIANITPHTFRTSYWIDKTINNYDIQSTKDFIYNMSKAVKDAKYDRIIDNIDVTDYLDWMVLDNDEKKDIIYSLYATIADGLNRQLEITENETINPYTETINGKKMFTTNTFKQLYMDYKKTGDIDNTKTNIRILERVLKIKFIIFEMFPHDLPISIGDMILYKSTPHRVLSITKTEDNYILYNLYNGYSEIKNVPKKKIKIYDNNPLKHFRILCDFDAENQDIVFNDYMYMTLTTDNIDEDEKNKLKFKLVYNTQGTYIFSEDQIPIYIKYLIFNSCPNLNRDNLIRMGYGEEKLRNDILNFEDKRRRSIETQNIHKDINDIEEKIKEYKNQHKILKSIKNKSLEQQAEKLLYKEEIKDLQQRKQMLKEFLSQEKPEPVGSNPILGGASTLRPNEQYSSYISPYNPSGYPLNPNIPGNIIYLPRQGYPYQNYYYSNQYHTPYNVAQNKAKDQKSKLSFYVTIELELFPGTSANMFQKSVIKCQSTFERIREAWADIFGFEYRPAPMDDAYSYIAESVKEKEKEMEREKDKNKTEKKRKMDKNKTRKYRHSK